MKVSRRSFIIYSLFPLSIPRAIRCTLVLWYPYIVQQMPSRTITCSNHLPVYHVPAVPASLLLFRIKVPITVIPQHEHFSAVSKL